MIDHIKSLNSAIKYVGLIVFSTQITFFVQEDNTCSIFLYLCRC